MSPENRKVIGEIKTYFLSIEKLKKGLRHVYMKSYEIWSGQADEIGRMLGGWIKSSNNQRKEQAK